jgi:hypothetical protein
MNMSKKYLPYLLSLYRKTAVEVAEGLYKQARKRRRAGDTIIPLLETANADLAYLQ